MRKFAIFQKCLKNPHPKGAGFVFQRCALLVVGYSARVRFIPARAILLERPSNV
jgi:hypothetical protein